MQRGFVSQYFRGIGFKILTATEVDPETSHGHEFQGIQSFRTLFGIDRKQLKAEFFHLSDIHEDGVILQEGELTWYDARAGQPLRTPEYRLYYSAELTIIQEFARAGDLIVVALKNDDRVVGIIAAKDSTHERQIHWLFDLPDQIGESRFQVVPIDRHHDRPLDLPARSILEQLGMELEIAPAARVSEELFRRFPHEFPSTRIFSDFARETVPDVNPLDDPDAALYEWLEQEERLFREKERQLVSDRLRRGFDDDVDEFIRYSLSVHNRRKSRAGKALENQTEAVFRAFGLRFDRNAETEIQNSPDFLFPGRNEYFDLSFPLARLVFLGVKRSCKERWRQVLAEASRIKNKHLLTLEPAISESQTGQMSANHLNLVIPRRVHDSYTPKQREWLLSVDDFIQLVRANQDRA